MKVKLCILKGPTEVVQARVLWDLKLQRMKLELDCLLSWQSPVTRGLKFSPQNPPEDVPVSPELRRKSWWDTLFTLTSLSQFQNNETLNLKGIKGHFKDEI